MKTQYVIDLVKKSLFQIDAKTTTEEMQTNLIQHGDFFSIPAYYLVFLCSYVSNYRANVFNETITMKRKESNKNQLN